jgi:hypothetical protein
VAIHPSHLNITLVLGLLHIVLLRVGFSLTREHLDFLSGDM